MAVAPPTSPLRRLALRERDGCRLLADSRVGHIDGGEAKVRAVLQTASDRSAASDELARHRDTWQTRYHFSRERGNILRALDLPADAAVLEVGAGCGAVTRYLGETCAAVDAVEPTAVRAAIARLRTADLDSVEVFVGDLDAVPAEPAYDAIVLVGVLEYVGARDDGGERVLLLRAAAARLRPGGHVICAIENRLGVRYLCGAPEDHYGRPFTGLEDYPRPGPARTFARRELEALFARAGLRPRTFGVMHDYKFARLVFADELLASPARGAAWSVPTFPGGTSPHPQPRLASELHVWRGLVLAGLGGECANSWLVVASVDEPALWPPERLAAWFSTDRRAGFAARTELLGHGPDVRLKRRPVGPPAATQGGLRRICSDAAWTPAPALLDVLEEADEPELARWLGAWRALVEAEGGRNVDLAPSNLLVDGERLVLVDEELFDDRYDGQAVIERGVIQTALALAQRRSPDSWPPGTGTVADVLVLVARAAGAELTDGRLTAAVRREAELLVELAYAARGEPGWDAAVARQLAHFEAGLALPLSLVLLGDREMDLRAAAEADNVLLRRALDERSAVAEARVAEAVAARNRVERSRSWRLTAPLRRAAARLRGR